MLVVEYFLFFRASGWRERTFGVRMSSIWKILDFGFRNLDLKIWNAEGFNGK